MKYLFCVLIVIAVAGSCKKDEELISGNIEGVVWLNDINYTLLPAQKDVHVDLFMNSEKIRSALTDESGAYSFENLPYGRYTIRPYYSGFIRSPYSPPVYHVGGYSPTVVNLTLAAVPTYQIQIDSVSFFEPDEYLVLHLKVNADTVLPGNSFYPFRVFMSNSSDISKDKYTVLGTGWLADWPLEFNPAVKVAVYGSVVLYEIYDFEEISSQPIHMVVHPVANNQGYMSYDYLPESLGPASNEVVFNWNEISGE